MSEELENQENVEQDGATNETIEETQEVETEVVEKETVMTLESLKDSYKNVGRIAIRPFCDPTKPNMGLEEYNMVVFPGTFQMENMACIMYKGKLRYLNGLDEFAPEVKSITDPEKKAARIKEIRTIVSQLEYEKTYNKVNIDDEDFWNKIETFRPDNREMWGQMEMKCDNDPIFLNPATNTDHLLIILAIQGGGFPAIAKSLEDCKSNVRPKKWYLDKQSDSAGNKASVSKIKNKALAMLDKLADENPRKLFYVAKLVDNNSMQYKNSTLQSVIYDNMDEFITGLGVERSIKVAAQRFLDYANMKTGELKLRAVIKDATFYKIIIAKGDGMIHYPKGNIMLGRNASEVYEKLNNPMHDNLLDQIMAEVEQTWN
jgi:hypothetical protein